MNGVFKEAKDGQIIKIEKGLKPIYSISSDTTNPDVIGYGNLLHWSEGFTDHMEYTNLVLPSELEKLSGYKKEVQEYGKKFKSINQQALEIDIDHEKIFDMLGEVAQNARIVTDRIMEMREEQMSGKIHTFAWPLLLDHIGREGDYFLNLEEKLRSGEISLDQTETIQFWGEIMLEHSLFTAHLLDPDEGDLIEQSYDSSEEFDELESEDDPNKTAAEVDNIIKFKTELLNGVSDGSISSIIMPELADHMLKEAYYFKSLLELSQKQQS